ncbi:hypothetical protein EW146_g27 [Bondarzewia mesenterica]|uniref:F-box domain-containing protein n=1 Tax=Bondarzewia mesenterica TaxID=1095465 RepID=A0A4S4M8G4_9AGAM|nr:hypothetical protein EW146_g27 [Bondarzewia mesenterica]
MPDYLTLWELLHHTFSFLDKASNARNARVCRAWTEPALDQVWTLSDHFFAKIGTASYRTSDEYIVFALSPMEAQWLSSRKRRYTKLQQLGQTLPFSLDFNVWKANLRDILWMARHVVNRMPLIRHICIEARKLSQPGVVDQLCCLVRDLSRLETIDLPPPCLQSSLVSSFSRLEHLRTVSIGVLPVAQGELSKFLGDLVVHDMEPCAFPSLNALSFIASSLEDAAKLLSSPQLTISQLTSVRLCATFPVPRNPGYLRDFLTTISIGCTSLDELDIYLEPASEIMKEKAERIRSLNFGDIISLLQFQRLTKFTIRDARPIRITDEEISQLAERWPSLQKLSLNPCPALFSPPSLSLRALIAFAQHCSELTELGLCLDCDPPIHFDLSRSSVSFHKLSLLDLGASHISKSQSQSLRVNAALFLSRLVRKSTEIKSLYNPHMQKVIRMVTSALGGKAS